MRSVMTNFLTGSARPYVYHGLVFEANAQSRDMIASLQAHVGEGWQVAPKMAEESQMASKVADAVVDANPALDDAERQAARMQLAGYDAVFPISPDDAPSAPEMPNFGGGGGGGGGASAAEGRVARGAGAASRSRHASFAHASRSFRARGVVVGRDIGGKLDVTDLRWSILPPTGPGAATRVSLALKQVDPASGKADWRAAGAFDAGVLNQAIRYAADGRVIATTIMAGDGKTIGRLTYLHPTLADTPLGCRIVESDRWIDTFTFRGGGAVSAAEAQIRQDRQQTGHWLMRIKVAESVAASGRACPRPELKELLADPDFSSPHFSPAYGRALAGFVEQRLSRPAGSARFLQTASRCAMNSGTPAVDCLCQQVQPQGLPPRYWYPEDHTSQVRERPARLTPDLAWLRPSSDRLGNLDFWMHTTFSLRDKGQSDENMTMAFDFPAPALAALREIVRRQLPLHLQRSGNRSYEEFMRPLEEFVLAQRFARAAVDGKLGPDFPSARLLQLAQATRRFVPRQATLRWEAAGNPADLMALLKRTDQAAAHRYVEYITDSISRARQHRPMCDRASL